MSSDAVRCGGALTNPRLAASRARLSSSRSRAGRPLLSGSSVGLSSKVATRIRPISRPSPFARAKGDGLEIGLMRVATLLDNPTDEPLRRGLPALDLELLNLAREAAKRGFVSAPPQRTASELIASDLAVVG